MVIFYFVEYWLLNDKPDLTFFNSGIPDDRPLIDGDIINIDVTVS